MRTTSLITTFIMAASLGSAAHAMDCGQPPHATPTVTAASKNLTVDSLRDVRNAVVQYSARVDSYLACMDREGDKLLPYMTKDQQTRRDEDLNVIHERRRDVQIKMNDLIRQFRNNS